MNILQRDLHCMHSADCAVPRCLSVCPSVTHRYSVETGDLLLIFSNISLVETAKQTSLNFFHHQIDTPFWFFQTDRYGNIPTGTPAP